jgi:aminopeptidase N
MRRLLCAIGLFAASCGSDKGPQGPAEAEVRHYDYSIDLETRAAAVIATLEVTAEGNCFRVPMRADGLTDVTLDGDGASGVLDGGVLEACGDGWEVGETVELAAAIAVRDQTLGESQVGFSISEDAEGAPFTYLVSWVGGCDQFAPCDSRPDTFARYTFRVTHPADHTVLCPGAITRDGATLTTCDFSETEAPTYSTFGLMASPSWVEVDLGDWAGVAVSLYDLPSVDFAAAIDTAQHAAFLAWMQERFGPYPYGAELRLAVAPTYWNGFEHPGNIALSETLTDQPMSAYPDPLAHTINHELAHMWAGDRTTLASTADFVWKEAMAEYLTFAFTDEQVSAATAAATAAAWKLFARQSMYHPVPGEAPPLLDFYGDVYGPGPMVLFRQLEVMYSREIILGAIAELLGEPIIGVADVQAALETATGADLAGYFDRWVYGEGPPVYPRFAIDVADNGDGSFDVTATQQQIELGLAGAKFTVRLTGDNAETFDVAFDLGVDGAATTTVTATPGFPVTGFRFDPLSETLALGTAASVAPGSRMNPWVAPVHQRR